MHFNRLALISPCILLCGLLGFCDWSELRAVEPGPVGHWKLAGDTRDYSGNDNAGLNHGADLSASGPAGAKHGAAGFDGRQAWIEVKSGKGLNLGTGDFSISVRLETAAELDDQLGEILSQYDPVTRKGFNLGISHYSGVTSCQSNTRGIHFGIDNNRLEPQWTDHGRPGEALFIFSLAVHHGELYAGTCEPGRNQSGHVYRLQGKSEWVDCGSPDPCNSVSALAVFQGELYAGVAKYRLGGSALPESENPHLGGKVFRYAGGQKWIDCGQLLETEAVGGLVTFRGRLYASSLFKPAGFFRYEDDGRWTRLENPNGKRVESLTIYNGSIFASSYDQGHVFRYDGTTWSDCGQVGEAVNTQTYSFAVYEGALYVATWASGKVFRYVADNQWEDVGRLGSELEVMGMLVHNGSLFGGTLPLAEVYRYDGGTQWKQAGRLDLTPDVKYRRAWTMAEYQGRLFCGTLPSGHVLSLAAGTSVTYDDELPPGWRHLAAIRQQGRLKLYLDGKLVGTSAAFKSEDYDLSSERPFKIGFGSGDYFQGRLSDLRLYGRALSEPELAELAQPVK